MYKNKKNIKYRYSKNRGNSSDLLITISHIVLNTSLSKFVED